MRPTRSLICALTLLALPLLLVSPREGRTFELHRHSVMTYQVLTRHGMGPVAAGLVAFGAMLPDVEDCVPHCYCDFAPHFCQPDSAQAIPFGSDHFDNNLIDESINRSEDRMAQAEGGIVGSPTNAHASAVALIAFGKALHTMQDFYAHSTFVEINIFPGPGITTSLSSMPIWQGEPYALYSWHNPNLSGGGDLQTGYYLQGTPPGGYSHDQLNKDSPGSPEGSQPARVSGVSPPTNLYGVASGDVTGSMTFTDLGLAPQHTIQAYSALLNDGLMFPDYFAAQTRARHASATRAKQVQDFFAWVEQDPTMQSLARAADSIAAHASGDSIGKFPIAAIDADGVPIPSALSVPPAVPRTGKMLSAPWPDPFFAHTAVSFLAPTAGTVRVTVFDVEGRHIATLFDGLAPAGLHELDWDGKSGSGGALPAGLYLVRFSGFGRDEARRVALAR